MSNLPPGVSDKDTDRSSSRTEEQIANDMIEELTAWQHQIILSLIDIGFVKTWPKTIEDADDAISAIECFATRLKDFTITRSTDDPKEHEIWRFNDGVNTLHIYKVEDGEVAFHYVGNPKNLMGTSVAHFKTIAHKI